MSKGWNYVPGQWNFVCDSCGQKLKSGTARQRWDGFRVCPECWEPRHPQDFVRAYPDNQTVPWSRPETDASYVPMDYEYSLDDSPRFIDTNLTRVVQYYRTLTDTATFTEVLSFTGDFPLADSSTITDELSAIISYVRSLSDTVTMTDSLATMSVALELNGHELNSQELG